MARTAEKLERRQAQRLEMTVPVELGSGTGITRDLSICGVFVETEQVFSLGEIIQFTLVFEHVSPAQPVRLQCRGRVVRIEHRPVGGAAIAITAYRFDRHTHGNAKPPGT